MPEAAARDRLLPWLIGLVIIVGAAGAAAWMLMSDACAVPSMALFVALAVMPAVYVVLMFLTLTTQD
ncbi:hypothetical protein [Elioraea rosea]|uniref:hypothetical protein n=1 Tax=Elioraea rosea TaxID=2492390 RepID=UPI001183C76C|nr:hypothetical protein [Elioraea rosea]